jgi:hypothetical protein
VLFDELERGLDAPLHGRRVTRDQGDVVSAEGVLAADLGAHQTGSHDRHPHAE